MNTSRQTFNFDTRLNLGSARKLKLRITNLEVCDTIIDEIIEMKSTLDTKEKENKNDKKIFIAGHYHHLVSLDFAKKTYRKFRIKKFNILPIWFL